MNVIILYGLLACGTIVGMQEYEKIKELLPHQSPLVTYLEGVDSRSKTPLMNLLEKATDPQLEEGLPLLKNSPFNSEILGPGQETAFFYACDRQTTLAATLMMSLGCGLDPVSPAGRPLFFAFINANPALAQLLIQEGADPRVPSEIVALATERAGYAELKNIIEKAKIA